MRGWGGVGWGGGDLQAPKGPAINETGIQASGAGPKESFATPLRAATAPSERSREANMPSWTSPSWSSVFGSQMVHISRSPHGYGHRNGRAQVHSAHASTVVLLQNVQPAHAHYNAGVGQESVICAPCPNAPTLGVGLGLGFAGLRRGGRLLVHVGRA
jgi:hypothetical protein